MFTGRHFLSLDFRSLRHPQVTGLAWTQSARSLGSNAPRAGVGTLELARSAEAPQVRLIGYMSAMLIASGAVFHLVVGVFHFLSLRRAILPPRAQE
jgi:hypothetical protein